MFGYAVAQQALTLITQHMRDCERRSDAVERQLEEQSNASREMHLQNTARLEQTNARLDKLDEAAQSRWRWLMGLIITTLLGMMATLLTALIEIKR